jgi:hypothetical protein
MRDEPLTVKRGKGGLSYYKHRVFVCHFNARPRSGQEDVGFADFRFDALRPYLEIEPTIRAMQDDALPQVQIKSHKLWCGLHFPLSLVEHVAGLFRDHILSNVRT